MALLRGRRWGKTTLGNAWLAYLRKDEHLFKGTAMEGRMRNEPLIGVKLNFSNCLSVRHLVPEIEMNIQDGLRHANLADSWQSPLEGHRRTYNLKDDIFHIFDSMEEVSTSRGCK